MIDSSSNPPKESVPSTDPNDFLEYQFTVPSKDGIGHHNRVTISLVVPGCIDAKDLQKVKCFECEGIPLNPVNCNMCGQCFCSEFFIPQVNKKKLCPKCGK
mmetsp:Transcript_1386/g.888  ORF Transcript_1386/g.888 Transcript_1386/m.888 type:complete len:101 (+) Transcript_1386:229-531(+)